MTAFAPRSQRLPFPWQSQMLRAVRGIRLALAVCLALLLGSCSHDLTAPFVQLTLSGLPAGAIELDVDVKLGETIKPVTKFTGSPSSLTDVTISFPADSRGTLTVAVRALDNSSCLVATGIANLELTANQIYPLTIAVAVMTPTAACQNIMIPLTVAKTGDGMGTITATEPALNCGPTCTGQVPPGTLVTLTATPGPAPTGSTYQFKGWDVLSCTSGPTCSVQVTQALTVTATFHCSGFCPESLPTQTSALNGIWGFSTTKIVAVGDGGTILQSDGTTWKKVNSGVTANLRAIHGAAGSQTGVAVADGGVIIDTLDSGVSWAPMTNASTKNLRGVFVASATPLVAYAAGDSQGGNLPYLKYSAGSWAAASQGGFNQDWNSIFGLNSTTFLIVGKAGSNCLVQSDLASAMAGVTAPDLLGAWGTAQNNVIAVGVNSILIKFNGTAWSTPMTPPKTGVTMRAIFGFGASSIYAVGDAGNIWKYDSAAWTLVPSPSTTMALNGIWGNNANDFYVVGQGGLILHNRM